MRQFSRGIYLPLAGLLTFTTLTVLFSHPAASVVAADEAEIEVDGGLRGEHIAARVRVGTPPSTDNNCTWSKTEWTSTMPAQYPMFHNATPPEDIGYDAYVKTCTEPRREYSLHWIHDSVFHTIGNVAEDAVDRLVPKPAINFAPGIDRNVVNVGSWFWLDKSAWKTISVTAYVPTKIGAISATTSATPKKVIFSPGDGRLGTGDVTCDGPGRVWRRGLGDSVRTSCMYTYKHASHRQPRGVYNAKVSIEWDISVKMSLAKTPIRFKRRVTSMRTSTNVPIRVLEIQALTR
jgi:hypothetical protein